MLYSLMAKATPPLQYERFYNYDELTSFVSDLSEAHPDTCALSSLGRSREGRDLWMLTISDRTNREPDDKPGYLIHANIHATEAAGTHTSLYTARQLLVDRPDLLRRVTFYIVPRLNPDGAEQVIVSNVRVRSRIDSSVREHNTLYQEDINDDGLVLQMRIQDPDGEYVADPKDQRLLIRRQADSHGPFYRVLPEGLIHQWDGSRNLRVEGRSYDWNRNWSYDWRPEPEQPGAGDFPFSEKEMRQIGEFIHGRSNIFGVLGYHTGPNAVLRPPSTGAIDDVDVVDDQKMEDLARIAAEFTGFPVVPVIKYHGARSRDINLYGHFHNFGYQHLGLYVYEFELGVLLNSAGIPTDEIFAKRTDEEREALERRMMKWWDASKESCPLFSPWQTFDHPQLGQIEIGGFRYVYQYNPSLADLPAISKGTYRFTLSHAAEHPLLTVEGIQVNEIGDGIYRIRLTVANRGNLPTYVSQRGKSLQRMRGVSVCFTPAPGMELLSAAGHQDLGHMIGPSGGKLLEWFVAGSPHGQNALCELSVAGGPAGTVNVCINREEHGA